MITLAENNVCGGGRAVLKPKLTHFLTRSSHISLITETTRPAQSIKPAEPKPSLHSKTRSNYPFTSPHCFSPTSPPAAMSSHYKGLRSNEVVIHDKEKGTLTIKPRGLDITWGADPRYWKFSSSDPSSPVELLQVSWLEVNGSAELSHFIPGKEYAVRFKAELKPDNFGWADRPVYFMVKLENQRMWKRADLSTKAPGTGFDVPTGSLLTFKVPADAGEKVVEFGMYEIWKGRWKGGLVIMEVVIEPV